MEKLPDELLLRILELLPDDDLVHVVPCVCLRWSHLSVDSQIWKNRTYYINNQFDSDVEKFFSRKPALRSVHILKPVDEAVLRSLASHCPAVTSLNLIGEPPLTLDTLRLITSNCDQIRVLNVTNEVLRCPDKAPEVALMPHLETLRVYGDQPSQLRELGAGCERLRYLDLRMGDNFRLGDLGAPLLRRLQGLSICSDAVSPDIIHCADSLEKLTLHYYPNFSRPESSLAEDLLSLKALTHVDICNLPSSPQIHLALTQPQLRSLNLRGCRNLNDDLLLELCGRCPLLEDLDLSRCYLITSRGLSSMWSLRRLRRLYLNKCSSLGSGAMTHLALCDGFQELRMQGVSMHNMEPGVSQLLEL